ncbi:SAM-dependent methyltransferase [Elizabethkingia miricola]|uniref:Methyltransferase domain-containing protein n=2 Tax=Elizabethkingia miricola TaxID=172045 RepID=A0AAQ1T0I7_ELIMR|nr:MULTISPECIES: class I SAM-dependent methyltransferase [Elizabethkingia]KUG13754.1 SAM-dependent methyltransferase [Elizabethkingia miricola]KUY21294.1 SAM-dependent methyltransferase [Elizabethkingia miricola]MCL1653937.1 methyltransferase domain-containing protein [Elizabethkingia miricola]MCL1658309.1 methyltransferase domain-containing protein [Elizabethkingia miricola]MCL1677472.1 methyltransferase domain-containing protein [Elizabethkingia miricola]
MKKVAKFLLNKLPRPMLIRLSIVARPLIISFFKGDKFTDPIDGRSYRKFLPYGYGKQRENALSPGTLSLERHRQMWLYLERETDFFTKNYKVLHIAPEQEFLRKFKKQKNLEYTSADLFSPIVDVKADVLDLPFEDESYDIVICNHVLEHIVEDSKAMSELYRVMRKGGWGILQVPMRTSLEHTYEDFSITDPKERQKHFGQYDHVRWYGMDYFDRLKKVGFDVDINLYSQKFSVEDQKRYGLLVNEILPVVFKH